MDKEKIKQALDQFEDENYVDSKETLRGEIRDKVNSYLKDKLELEKDPVEVEEEEVEEEEEDDPDND